MAPAINPDIELKDLAQTSPRAAEVVEHENAKDNTAVVLWTWCSAGLLLLLSTCLTLFPRLLLFLAELSSLNQPRNTLTPLESFLALHFGILLAAISFTLVLNVPSPSTPVVPQNRYQGARPEHPLLGPLTTASALTAFLSYNTKEVGLLGMIVFTGSAIMSVWGLWAVVFAGPVVLSKKTGADKHTSAFLFGNKSAASVRKREWRKRQ